MEDHLSEDDQARGRELNVVTPTMGEVYEGASDDGSAPLATLWECHLKIRDLRAERDEARARLSALTDAIEAHRQATYIDPTEADYTLWDAEAKFTAS
jgi:hypothetical protein